jgi:hypothetical protein
VYTLDLVGISGAVEDNNIQRFEVDRPVMVPVVVRSESWYFSTHHRDYKESLPSILRAWFERRAELKIAARAYTELLCTDGMSPEALFLRTVQTLEHFHGVLWREESRYVERGTLRQLVRWLRNNFPDTLGHVPPDEMQRLESQKETLLSRIGGLNHLSLQSRLEKIFLKMPGRELMPVLDNPRNAEECLRTFLKHLVATRHYLTHFNEENQGQVFQGDDLEKAALRCWAALTFWIARHLGIDEERAGDMALAAKEAMFLVSLQNKL